MCSLVSFRGYYNDALEVNDSGGGREYIGGVVKAFRARGQDGMEEEEVGGKTEE